MVLAFFFKRTLVIKLVRDRSTFFLRSKMKAKPPPPPKKKQRRKRAAVCSFSCRNCVRLSFFGWFGFWVSPGSADFSRITTTGSLLIIVNVPFKKKNRLNQIGDVTG